MSLVTNHLNIRGTVEYESAHFRGLWLRGKKRLADERTAHAEELRRAACQHRDELYELEQSLLKEFEERLNSQLTDLKGNSQTRGGPPGQGDWRNCLDGLNLASDY